MRILIVCSINSGHIAPFIKEQVETLNSLGVHTDYFLIQQKGILGYLRERKGLKTAIDSFKPDLIHAHYGLSGLLANLQRTIPVVTTYHGSDINDYKVYRFSRLAILFSAHNIFVSEKNKQKAGFNKNQSLIPCGVNTQLFQPQNKEFVRKELGLDLNRQYVLFAGAFKNLVKNAFLAKAAVKLLPRTTLLELDGYSRKQVAMLMNAVDAVLMTSFTEGSPQFIKEAMSCNCPIVSVPVGNVSEMIEGLEGCYTVPYDAIDIAKKLEIILEVNKRTVGRERIIKLGLDDDTVAGKVLEVYQGLI